MSLTDALLIHSFYFQTMRLISVNSNSTHDCQRLLAEVPHAHTIVGGDLGTKNNKAGKGLGYAWPLAQAPS